MRKLPATFVAVQDSGLPRDSQWRPWSARSAGEIQPIGQPYPNVVESVRPSRADQRRSPSRSHRRVLSQIAAFERKVGQLTMELNLLKKAPRLRLVNNNEQSSIISGPKAVSSDDDAK